MKNTAALLLALILMISAVAAFAESEAESMTPYAYWAVETLPKIYIDTEEGMALDDPSLLIPDEHKGMNGQIPVYDYVNATITVTDCEGYELDGIEGKVKIRGNYTSDYPKKPIRIKFNEKQAMCGLNGGAEMKSWVLLAEYKDSTLLKNSVALYIANSLYSTTGNYATDFRNVEVYLNGEYNGLYVLAEQQEVNKNRVNISEPENPEDAELESLTDEELAALKDGRTGYFFEYDGYYTNEDPSVTFTIRYDAVTRPNGQTFLPSSEGNNTEAMDESTSGGADNGSWGGQQDTNATATDEGEGGSDGASQGEQQENSETAAEDGEGTSDGASWGGQQENSETATDDGEGASDGASWDGQQENSETATDDGEGASDGASWGGQQENNDTTADNGEGGSGGASWGGQQENSETAADNGEGASNGASWGGQQNGNETTENNRAQTDNAGDFAFGWGDRRMTGFTIHSDFYYEEQRDFIQHTVQTVWDVIYDAVYTDHSDLEANPYHTMDGDGNYIADGSITTAYDAVASVVDIDSLIDMYIIQEICEDSDLDWSSFFFSIDMSPEGNHLLTYTAPWDFDSGFNTGSDTNTLYAVNYNNPWLVIFCSQDWFWQRLSQRWDEAEEAGVFTGVLEMVDTLSTVNEEAYERNLALWTESGMGDDPSAGSSGDSNRSQAQEAKELHSWLETKIRNAGRLIHEMAGETAE